MALRVQVARSALERVVSSTLERVVSPTLERLVRPRVTVLGRTWVTFQLLGCVGFTSAVALCAVLEAVRHGAATPRPSSMLALTSALGGPALASALAGLALASAMAGVALGAALGLYWLVLRATGADRLVYYRYELTVLGAIAASLWLLDVPVLPHLDVAVLGLGAFLVWGRLGCFMAGCCYGVPHVQGVSYGQRHVRHGFSVHLEAVPLLPTQLLEAAWVLLVTVGGVSAFVEGAAPGSSLAGCVVLYGVGRFALEFLRGDPHRAEFAGFSEAQWTSALLVVLVSMAELAGVLPWRASHLVHSAGVVAAMAAVATARRLAGAGAHLLSHPRHLDELASLLFALSREGDARPMGTRVGRTSLGIHLSVGGPCAVNGVPHWFVTLSRERGILPHRDARILARWIARMRGVRRTPPLQRRPSGVWQFQAPVSKGPKGTPPVATRPASDSVDGNQRAS